jgi:RHS repeat-associated protein
MPGRTFVSEGYRYGYQGSEREAQLEGGSAYSTEYRILDPRIARWFSPDPITREWESPFTSMDNDPVNLTDIMGLEPGGGGKGGEHDYTMLPSGADANDGARYQFKPSAGKTVESFISAGTAIAHSYVAQIQQSTQGIFNGFVNALGSNYVGGQGRINPDQYSSSLASNIRFGQQVGDVVSIGIGAIQMGTGIGEESAGLVLAGSGYALPGSAIAIHGQYNVYKGLLLTHTASQNLFSAKKSNNQVHGNQGGKSSKQNAVSPPESLDAFPEAKSVKPKTLVQGGGGKRARWKDKKGKIYEWDYKKGEVEIYDKTGKIHLGGYDPKTGKQISPAQKNRRIEP